MNFGLMINRKCIKTNLKLKELQVDKNIDEKKMYSEFLNEKYFYEELFDEDNGNQDMKRMNLE
jgi:hypothetical protein